MICGESWPLFTQTETLGAMPQEGMELKQGESTLRGDGNEGVRDFGLESWQSWMKQYDRGV